ncbi:MAG: methyltransferase domain-containing protein [Lysobacterales bacterium]|nr:methyltransferase domain-containing protein [Rhodanobacteraceae bacterium]
MNGEQDALSAGWAQRYRDEQIGWDRGAPSPALEHWISAGAIQQGDWLIPGCGQGWEVDRLAGLGCRVTAIDIVPVALARVRARLDALQLQARLIEADVLGWTPDAPFDGIYEQTCLCALHPSSWAAYETQLHRCLRPGGSLLALFMQTGRAGGPPFDSPLALMRELFAPSRWEWPQETPQRWPHPSGLHELAVRLRRLDTA